MFAEQTANIYSINSANEISIITPSMLPTAIRYGGKYGEVRVFEVPEY